VRVDDEVVVIKANKWRVKIHADIIVRHVIGSDVEVSRGARITSPPGDDTNSLSIVLDYVARDGPSYDKPNVAAAEADTNSVIQCRIIRNIGR
jgi:hypothetical protein